MLIILVTSIFDGPTYGSLSTTEIVPFAFYEISRVAR